MADMYNIELKQRFIDDREESVILPNGYLNRWFIKTAEFEKLNQKDVSNFTYYEILDMYKTFNLNSVEVLQVLNSQLSKYTQWCLQQNLVLDSQNHFLEFKRETFLDCINILMQKLSIVTREQVLDWARQLRNPSDSFIFLALFEGIKGQNYSELAFLKISDFDGNKVRLNSGREITVSNELYNFALEANYTLTYYSVTENEEHVYTLNADDLIIKNYHNTTNTYDVVATGQRIRSRIRRNAKFLGIDAFFKSNTLTESGKIDYIKRKSKELGISCQKFIIQYTDMIEKQFDCTIPRPNGYYDKYKEYLD